MFEDILGNIKIEEYINKDNVFNEFKESNQRPFINDDNDFSENCRRSAFVLNKLDGTFIALKSLVHNIIPTNAIASIQTDIQSNHLEEANTKICKYINRIIKVKKALNVLKPSLELLVQIIDWAVNNIEETMAKWILSKCQISILHIKKILSFFQEYVLFGLKYVFVGISFLKGSWLATTINATVMVLLQTVKALNIGISYVVMAFEMVLNAMPNIFSIGAEQICFFMTPKSMTNSICNILNTNRSAVDRIPNVLKEQLSNIELVQKIKNKTVKISIIAAGAAAGLACAYTEFEIPSNICKLIEIADPAKIISMITNILRYLLDPYALPKYEELLPVVPGYVIWLITGFVPAGHKSFGIPTYP